MIFNAEDLSLEAHVTGTDLVLLGGHAQFFPRHVGTSSEVTSAPGEAPPTPPVDGAMSLRVTALSVAALCSMTLQYLLVL